MLLQAGASINMNSFTSATVKNKLTDQIQSEDMRSLLIEFCLDRVNDDSLGFSFNEQVLLAVNRRLTDELHELRRTVDQLSSRAHKRQTYAPASNPTFFEAQSELPEDQRDEDTRTLKRNKQHGID